MFRSRRSSSMKSDFSKAEARIRVRPIWAHFLSGPGANRALTILADYVAAEITAETRFLATIALADEVDLLALLAATGLPVYAPLTRDAGRMEFRLLFDSGSRVSPITPGFRGIPGPPAGSALLSLPLTSADVAFIPSRAANPNGHRLGRGLGYYDRWRDALLRCRRLAVLPEEACRLPFPAEEHDLKLDLAFTENGPLEY